jgi:hypothetical protein
MNFKYMIPNNQENADVEENFCAAREPSEKEVICVRREANGATMVLANQEGWEYLAKICLEMAYTFEKDPGYHIHRTSDFQVGNQTTADEIGLFHIGKKLAESVIQSRTEQSEPKN